MAENQDLKDALTKLEKRHQIYNYLVSLGASLEGANLIAHSDEEARRFHWNGYELKLRDSEQPVIEDQRARDLYLKGPFAALFPNAKQPPGPGELASKVDPVVLQAARNGNWTARGTLLKSLQGDEAAYEKVLAGSTDAALGAAAAAAAAAAANGHDAAAPNNPWSNTPANTDARGRYTAAALTRQAQLVKANPMGAAQIAAAVGSMIGDTTARRKAS